MNIAIFVDGGYFKIRYLQINGNYPEPDDVIKYCGNLLNKIYSDEQEKKLFRIYYYDCFPYNEEVTNPISREKVNYKKTSTYKKWFSFLRELSLKDNVALREGSLKCRGWKLKKKVKLAQNQKLSDGDIELDLVQKSVDIKIGLDISWISLNKIVNKVILITGDADFIPVMKLARKEGLMVYLDYMLGSISQDLRKHSDIVIEM
jgi:uncharacterized LabA/DUF88 family protein